MPRSIDDDRYLTQRRNQNGTVRYYWQPPGQKPVRLPDGPEMKSMLTRLNQQRDATRSEGVVVEGTVAWVSQKYRESEGYQNLSESSKAVYSRWLKEFDKRWGQLPATAITRRGAIKLKETYKGRPSTQNHAVAVLYNVLEEARYWGYVEGDNPASRLKLAGTRKRDRVCSPDERWAFLRAARSHPDGYAIRLYFHLCYYTGQRPCDVVQMKWGRYNGDTIELVQQKTKKLIAVPCHRNLRRILAVAKANANSVFIVSKTNGRPWSRPKLSKVAIHTIMPAAGIEDLQVRDVRRTAVVALGMAGCTETEIANITGHEIEKTRRILETYLPRNVEIARAGIAKWERSKLKKSNALDLKEG